MNGLPVCSVHVELNFEIWTEHCKNCKGRPSHGQLALQCTLNWHEWVIQLIQVLLQRWRIQSKVLGSFAAIQAGVTVIDQYTDHIEFPHRGWEQSQVFMEVQECPCFCNFPKFPFHTLPYTRHPLVEGCLSCCEVLAPVRSRKVPGKWIGRVAVHNEWLAVGGITVPLHEVQKLAFIQKGSVMSSSWHGPM